MKTGKLRNKILAFALPLTIIPFALTALAVYYFVIRSYQIQIEDEQNKRLAEAVVDIRREQEGAQRDVALIANLPIVDEYLEAVSESDKQSPAGIQSREAAVRASLQLFFDRNPYYLQLGLVDAQGQERVKLTKLPEANALKSIKNEDLFRRMLIARGAFPDVQMPVEAVQPGHFTSMFTSRVRRERFAGVVVLHLNTAVFERNLRPLLASYQLSTVLFDDRGLVFAKSVAGVDEEKSLNQINLTAEATALLSGSAAGVSPRQISGASHDYLFSILPAEALISFGFMEPVPGEKWFLGVLRPKDTITGQMRAFQAVFFLIFVGALGAVFWTTTHYSRRFTRPLEQMAEATTKIARGQFDIRLGVKTGDEVEELAAAVKQMADDLNKYQFELVKSAKLAAIGEMAAEVSHEIQNRISGVSLWIQYLDAEIAADDPRREYLQEMKQGLQGFLNLLADLKQFYRTPLLQLSDANLNALVRESLLYVGERVKEGAIEVDLQLDPDLPAVKCDGDKIKSVILNLLINAIESGGNHMVVQTRISDFRPQTSDLRPQTPVVRGMDDHLTVELSIEDNGVGIAEEDLPRIFYPFHSTKAGGSGLGLAIASNLVTAHGGKIEVESRPGGGATFTVRFQELRANIAEGANRATKKD
jgi:signal transduction histidine kinase